MPAERWRAQPPAFSGHHEAGPGTLGQLGRGGCCAACQGGNGPGGIGAGQQLLGDCQGGGARLRGGRRTLQVREDQVERLREGCCPGPRGGACAPPRAAPGQPPPCTSRGAAVPARPGCRRCGYSRAGRAVARRWWRPRAPASAGRERRRASSTRTVTVAPWPSPLGRRRRGPLDRLQRRAPPSSASTRSSAPAVAGPPAPGRPPASRRTPRHPPSGRTPRRAPAPPRPAPSPRQRRPAPSANRGTPPRPPALPAPSGPRAAPGAPRWRQPPAAPGRTGTAPGARPGRCRQAASALRLRRSGSIAAANSPAGRAASASRAALETSLSGSASASTSTGTTSALPKPGSTRSAVSRTAWRRSAPWQQCRQGGGISALGQRLDQRRLPLGRQLIQRLGQRPVTAGPGSSRCATHSAAPASAVSVPRSCSRSSGRPPRHEPPARPQRGRPHHRRRLLRPDPVEERGRPLALPLLQQALGAEETLVEAGRRLEGRSQRLLRRSAAGVPMAPGPPLPPRRPPGRHRAAGGERSHRRRVAPGADGVDDPHQSGPSPASARRGTRRLPPTRASAAGQSAPGATALHPPAGAPAAAPPGACPPRQAAGRHQSARCGCRVAAWPSDLTPGRRCGAAG